MALGVEHQYQSFGFVSHGQQHHILTNVDPSMV